MLKLPKQTILVIILGAIILIGGIFFLFSPKPTFQLTQEKTDELTGTWRAEGTSQDGYAWFVIYTFKNGSYDMQTESSFKDNGTYVISKRFEDKSVQVTKTSIPFQKTYDIFVTILKDGKTIVLDGMTMYRQ